MTNKLVKHISADSNTIDNPSRRINHNPQIEIKLPKNDFIQDEVFSPPKIEIRTEPQKINVNGYVLEVPRDHAYLNKDIKSRMLNARLPYPHVAIGSFARAFRDYIHYSIYDGFSALIFGPYTKSIQSYFQRRRYNDNDEDGVSNMIDFALPIFSYTISLDGVDDKIDFSWRSTTFLPGLAKVVYPSFYEDDDFELKMVYRRLKGSISANMFCNSEAELLDIEMAFIDGFRGMNVYNQTDITAMTILPANILFTTIDGNRISRALSSDKITRSFIPAVNSTNYYIYNNISAIINMQSISQNSQYYGGSGMPEFILNASFNFEIEIPQYIMALTKPNITGIELNMDVAYRYENNKALNAIRYITGDKIDNNASSEILEFTNGRIIDKVAFNISNEDFIKDDNDKVIGAKLNISKLFSFEDKDHNPRWNYKNRDIILLILYSGGVIRVPFDEEIAKYDENGNVVISADIFNVEDFVEIYVFKFKANIDK